VAVINHGRLVALDTPQGLKRLVRDQAVIEVELFGVPPEVVERIRREPYVDAVSVEDQDQRQLLLVQSSRGAEAVQDVLDQLRDLRVGKVNVREPTLEDAYVRLVEGTP
jgi:ABC-2 type transport system ATP-binding protein